MSDFDGIAETSTVTPAKERFTRTRNVRFACAVIVALLVAYATNRVAMAWLGDMDVDPKDPQGAPFHDGCALLLTLAIPALVGGGCGGLVARADGYYAAALAFVFWSAAGAFRPFWVIPVVAPQAEHSSLLHFFLYNPLPTLPFGAFGGWLAGQFSSGKFSLNDAEPVVVPGSDE